MRAPSKRKVDKKLPRWPQREVSEQEPINKEPKIPLRHLQWSYFSKNNPAPDAVPSRDRSQGAHDRPQSVCPRATAARSSRTASAGCCRSTARASGSCSALGSRCGPQPVFFIPGGIPLAWGPNSTRGLAFSTTTPQRTRFQLKTRSTRKSCNKVIRNKAKE